MNPYKAKHGEKILEVVQVSHDGHMAYAVHRYEGKTLGAKWYKIAELEKINEL